MLSKAHENTLRSLFMQVENPGRYTGGEYGSHNKTNPNDYALKIALSYPDLYEIGMSNNAVKILYNIFNKIDNVICDRVFAPAFDFEKLLKKYNIPLFTIETRTPLENLDILGFSFGYELTAANMLNIMALGGVPVFSSERKSSHPIVIAGGPCVTNPVPYSDFIDLFFIGEAEEEFKNILDNAVDIKKKGGAREDLLSFFKENRYIWHKGKKEKVFKAIYHGFSAGEENNENRHNYFIVPSVKSVQDNGVVEIMRGCPNSCRFCHAGFYYRPKREKSLSKIESEVKNLVFKSGCREITLSSLSSGDYTLMAQLIKKLNKKYSGLGVSFSFPSLKINNFTLSFLNELVETRKSGLTFAVETPDPIAQAGINKEVSIEHTIEIIKEAKKLGWHTAKFYFMIGLSHCTAAGNVNDNSHNDIYHSEADKIIDFLFKVKGRTGININANIGTFIPKAHTPYQWAAQMKKDISAKILSYIKTKLKNQNIKVGYHAPAMSFAEGIFSRGDERAGKLLYDLWKAGAKFDAWEEHFDEALWEKVINSQNWNVEEETCRKRESAEKFPWENISLGIDDSYFAQEWNNSHNAKKTLPCEPKCRKCGVCSKDISVINTLPEPENDNNDEVYTFAESSERYRVIFSFAKTGMQIFIGHLDTMRLFEKAFQRSMINVKFTSGFNPKPKLEFANPLSLGIESLEEIAAVETTSEYNACDFAAKLNAALPQGITVKNALCQKIITGEKIVSLMSLYSGSCYTLTWDNAADDSSNAPAKSSYEKLLKDYIAHNGIENSVKIEKPVICGSEVSAAIKELAAEKNTLLVTVLVKPNQQGGKSLLKILKEALNIENPLAEISVVREKMFADSSLRSYFSFFA